MTTTTLFHFNGAACFDEPFPFFARASFLSSAAADALLSACEADGPWSHPAARRRGDAVEVPLDAVTGKRDLSRLADATVVDPMRRHLGRLFGDVPLGPARVAVRRLAAPGQIPVACGEAPGGPALELVVHLNRGSARGGGGGVLLMDPASLGRPSRTHRTFLPLHRSAVAFPLTSRSFHGVARVTAGVQYALVFSFFPPEPPAYRPPSPVDGAVPPTLRSGELALAAAG